MERRQLDLRLSTEEERAEALSTFLRPVELASRLVSALCVIVARGDQIQIGIHPAVRIAISKSEAAQVAKRLQLPNLSPNTWSAAVSELESMRIVGVLRSTQPWTYVLSLEAIGRMQPAPQDKLAELAALPCFQSAEPTDRSGPVSPGQPRSGPVSPGQVPVSPGQVPVSPGQPRSAPVIPQSGALRVRVQEQIQNPCNPCTVTVVSSTRPDGLTDRLRMPWHRQDGLTGDDLVWSVRTGELEPIRRLYMEGKQLEWIGTSEDDLVRFLTAVHHCATCAGLHNRMAVLAARVKRDPIDVSNTKQESDKWAGQVIKRYATCST